MKKDISLIPNGSYCYEQKDGKKCICPYFELRNDKPSQNNGYCHYIERGDWQVSSNSWDSLLWDQVKECGIKTDSNEVKRLRSKFIPKNNVEVTKNNGKVIISSNGNIEGSQG